MLAVLVVLLAATFSAITLVIVRENTQTLRRDLVGESRSFAALATQPIGNVFVIYQESGTLRIQQEVHSFTALDSSIDQVEVIDTSGNQQFADTSGSAISVSKADASSVDPSYIYKNGNLMAIVEPYIESYGIHRYAIVYGISYASVNKNIRDIVTIIISLSTVILLVSLFGWYVLINRLFVRPVAQISHAAILISRGDLNRKINLGRNDEIGDLSTAVDTMAMSLKGDIAKLQEVDRLKSEFLMITSHNLRTPLTIIEGYIDIIKTTNPPKGVSDMLEPISTNVLRLQGFAEDVLTISTIETGQGDIRREPMAMGPVLERVAGEFTTLAKQKQLHFVASIATPEWASIDKSHFHSAIWNLLDNAYKFSKQNGTVELLVRSEAGRLNITIRDSGIGISPTEIPKLFTKFHRGTDTLTYDYEGTGIGLYITKIIMEQHGGGVDVHSIQGQGSSFTLWLPTVPQPKPAETSTVASKRQTPAQAEQQSPSKPETPQTPPKTP